MVTIGLLRAPVLNKSLTYRTLCAILAFGSTTRATCLVITNPSSILALPNPMGWGEVAQTANAALSFHRVREEAMASGFVGFFHIDSACNPADILSKHWGYAQVWDLVHVLGRAYATKPENHVINTTMAIV